MRWNGEQSGPIIIEFDFPLLCSFNFGSLLNRESVLLHMLSFLIFRVMDINNSKDIPNFEYVNIKNQNELI